MYNPYSIDTTTNYSYYYNYSKSDNTGYDIPTHNANNTNGY